MGFLGLGWGVGAGGGGEGGVTGLLFTQLTVNGASEAKEVAAVTTPEPMEKTGAVSECVAGSYNVPLTYSADDIVNASLVNTCIYLT